VNGRDIFVRVDRNKLHGRSMSHHFPPLALLGIHNEAFRDPVGPALTGTSKAGHRRGERPALTLDPHCPASECLDASETPLVRVLVVEDSRSDLLVLENALAEVTSVRFELTSVGRLKEAMEVLPSNEFDVILSDLGLPDSSGLDTLVTIQKVANGLPIIVMTGLSDERMGIRAMQAGAQDYFVKGHFWENGLVRAIRDAIERRRMEEAIRRSEDRFRASIESLLDGFALLTPIRTMDGVVSGFSVDYINASGLSLRPAAGPLPSPFTLHDLFPDCHEQGLFEKLVRVEGGGDPFIPECVLICHELASELKTPTYDFRAAKTTDGVAISWRDVTPRLRLEAQLLQSEKMNSIGQLAGGIAHDFNNLLTVIHGHADCLRDSACLPRELADPVREISAAAVRATNLTKQLLTFSRQHPMIAADIDLNETVAQMSNMLDRILGEELHLQVQFRRPAPFVRADRGMIEQILLNLAVNARDSMPKGGELAIATAVRAVDQSELQMEHDVTPGRFVCLSVRDTGCGIAPDHLSKIFEPFFTTKEVGKGTGLGLATVYGIVKQHKGFMKVESKIGQGTTFEVFLPYAETKAPVPAPIIKVARPAQGTETILLVEDEDTIRELAKLFLESHGYHVLDASNGPEALEIWKRDQARVDLLLTDLVMPHGVSGQALAQLLQSDRPNLKVIYSSGYSCDLFGENSFLDPETNFLQKPYRLDSLAEMIRHCIDGEAVGSNL
jgi:two-component system, cell cycle sensor histidine kinase and response regulator CckA